MTGQSNTIVRFFSTFLISCACLYAPAATAQALTVKKVDDPQVHMANISKKCLVDLGSCVRDGLIETFGPGVEGNQEIMTMVRTFSGIKASNWVILSDTNYSDTVRVLITVVVCDHDTQAFFRTQYLKDGTKWRAMAIDVQTSFKDILIPYLAGGAQIPISQVSAQSK